MSNFGKAQEAGEGYVSKLFTGLENFRVTHVCPSHDELKEMYGENAKEDTYVLTTEEGEQQVKIVLYLDNEPEEGEESIKTRLTYFVTKAPQLTRDGSKTQYINVYGKTAWLTSDAQPNAQGNYEIAGDKGVYVFEGAGARPAYKGEEQLISFIRNLLNISSLEKAEKPEDAESQFSVQDWNAMFSGNFSNLRNIVGTALSKVGILLGVKTVDGGKMYQDVFSRQTVRQWVKASRKYDYLRKQVVSAQQNGAYPNTYFGAPDYVLREFTEDVAPTNESALTGGTESPAEEFDFAKQFGEG